MGGVEGSNGSERIVFFYFNVLEIKKDVNSSKRKTARENPLG